MQALQANTTASNNTAVGYEALKANTTGAEQTTLGYRAGTATTTGGSNTFIGRSAGESNTTGSFNTFLGNSSGEAITTGTKNTVIGRYTGNQGGLDIRTASNYIVLSDGDGNPRMFWNGANATQNGGLTVGSLGDLIVDTTSTAAVVTVGRQSGTGSDNTNFRVRNRVDVTAFFVNAGDQSAYVGTTFGVGNTTGAASGAGITFPATQNASSNANTLDDYEEGTFTPAFSPSSGTWTSSSSQGFYTKIGNTVVLQMYLTITTVGSGSGFIDVAGLPFTTFNPSVGAGNRAAIGVVREDATTGVISQIYLTGNATIGSCQDLTGGNVAQASGNIYDITVTYFTTT
jgi:hypothetical protein